MQKASMPLFQKPHELRAPSGTTGRFSGHIGQMMLRTFDGLQAILALPIGYEIHLEPARVGGAKYRSS